MAESQNGLPVPESYEQILSNMLSAYAAKVGVTDLAPGSLSVSFFEVVALATARASGDLFQILKDFSVDRATGESLKRLATENKVTPLTARPATGLVTVTDSSFEKISTKVYAGAIPPNIGSTSIKVSDASLFPSSGSIYIGRGTPNIEGPIAYSSITPTGGYYVLNLSTATTKFHNVGETVILAQGGNRVVPVNSVVLSPSTGSSADIQYNVVASATILDGEVSVENVQVAAQKPGSSGNVPRGAIRSFASPPFTGATVTNPLPFTTGADSETDDQLRVRIKRALASKGLGTVTAIESAVIGATASDEPQSSIVSADMTTASFGSILYIDDGKGYEALTAGVGLETITDSALGGEQYFQLITGGRQAPIAKAFLQSTFTAPFDLIGGDTLAITTGEVTQEHVFSDTDFISPGSATAFEVTASINANTTLDFEATTAEDGQYVVIRFKGEGNDTIKTSTPTTNGRDAAVLLGLPSNEVQTLRLYKNKIPLSKDGKTASIFTQSQSLWSPTIVTGDTLILSVDGTAPISYTVTDADFIATGLYTQVSSTNSLESWQQVLNSKLTGITVSIVGQQLEVSSNLGANNRAQVVIDPSSTLVTKGMFSSLLGLSSSGAQSDYVLDRNSAQIKLTEPLVAGDSLSAGTNETEARVSSALISGGSITFTQDSHIWILIDNPGQIIQTGVAGSTLLSVSTPSANTIRYTSSIASAFQNVLVGDYVIVWSEELASGNRIEGRVKAVTNTTLDVLITPAEYALVVAAPSVIFSEGFAVVRSTLAPQKFKIATGIKTLDQIAAELQSQTNSLTFSVDSEQYLVVRSKSKDTTGSILVVTSDKEGKLLNIDNGSSSSSKDSLIAYYTSGNYDASFPLFVHSSFASGAFADPIDSYINSVTSSLSLSGRDPNELLSILHRYGTSDTQPYGEYVQESTVSGVTIGIEDQNVIRRLRADDRYFIANPLDFGSNDSMIAIVDGDVSAKTFEIPFYRKALTNTSYINNSFSFNAYDTDSGPTANFSSAFGSSFDFSNFKVLMQAKRVLKPTPIKTALLFRASKWGRSGEKINIGYVYPSVANSDVSSVITVDQNVNIRISLKSGASIATSIDSSTEWNVSITPNTPVAGIDQVTYTYSGTGSAPALTLSGGEYVVINPTSEFDVNNTGTFRVSTEAGFLPTATSFTVQRPNGVAVSESNRATLVSNAITFFASSATTAADVDTYVSNNLTDFVTSSIMNDSGTDGSGIIELSTWEDSIFSYESVYLLDGINWIASSNLGASPNFTFKNALQYDSGNGYAFNDSEEVRLVPTTMEQVKRFISVLAVTGFSTVGSIGLTDRGSRLELSTNVLGSDGSIQISGGLANDYSVPVLDSASRVDNSLMSVSLDRVSSAGMHSDQWFKLEAAYSQRKEALLSSNSSVTVLSDTPTIGQSTIQLLGRAMNQRYFGKPRHHVRTAARTFKVEKQGDLTCLSFDNLSASPAFLKVCDMNDSLGGTVNVSKVSSSSDALYTILTGDTNFTEVSIGDLLVVQNMALSGNNGTFLVTGVSDDGTSIRVLNKDAENEYSTSSYTLSTNSTAGDTFTIGATNLVAGTNFAIGATAADTATNLSAVIGTIAGVTSSVSSNIVTITGTSVGQTTSIAYSGVGTVIISSATLVGTSFATGDFSCTTSVSEGDTMVISDTFNVLNQGKFRVIRRQDNSVWFENDTTIDEEVTLPLNLISTGVDATTSLMVNATNNSLYITWNGIGTQPDFSSVKMGDVLTLGIDFAAQNQGDFMVLRSSSSFIEAINPSAVNESPVFVTSGLFQVHRPQIQFTEYEATVVGDKFVSTGDTLTVSNIGSFAIVDVIDRDNVVVTGTLTGIVNSSLNGRETSVYVEEGVPYTGYKKVSFMTAQPGTALRSLATFDTNAQYSKINESAGVQINSIGKMSFGTSVKSGLDSYRYNTGLIAEANRIIYGEPRDPATYPGVGAAGADIFVQEPLTRRIQVSVDIRINTGVPFASTAEQVRTSIASLVNSNPIGEPIAISSIVSVVNAIPGVRAMAVSSPQYDSQNDLIYLAPGEKARIINISSDINVSQLGT